MSRNYYDNENEDDVFSAAYEADGSFERLKTKNTAKKIGRRVSYVLITLVLLSVFLLICAAAFLKIQTMNVEGNEQYSSEDILKASGIDLGTNMYAINKKTAIDNIKQNFLYIDEVKIRRTLPDTLTFHIKEMYPKYYMEICGEYFMLSDTLLVMEKITDESKIDGNRILLLKTPKVRSAVVGENVEFENELTYEYINTFIMGLEENEFSKRITMIDISNKYNIYVNCENRFNIYLGDNEEIGVKLNFAKSMIDNFDQSQRGEVDAHNVNVGSVILER